MNDPLFTSLAVSGIGMLMLFLALTLLYGLMYLMTLLVKDRPEAKTQQQMSREDGQRAMRQRAAVVAVALARAEQDLSIAGAPGAPEGSSAWRMLHHNRQLTPHLRMRRIQ